MVPTTTQPPVVTDEGDEAPDLPDLTARPVTTEELTSMLPSGETGVAATDAGPQVTVRSNETLITDAVLDRDDEVGDIAGSGRVTGVAAAYTGASRDVHVWIDVFEDASGAHEWLIDVAGDIAKRTGGSHTAAIDLITATEYPIEGIGDESIGLVLELREGRVQLTETLAMFRMGRIVAYGSVVHTDPIDARVPVQYLAEEVEGRILDVLLRRNPEPGPGAGPDGYRFEYRQMVRVAGGQWSTTAEGTVSGSDVSCRVRLDRPDVTADREYIVVDGRAWSRASGLGDYVETGSAGILDRTLLAYCPLWPIDLFEAGLGDVARGTPAHHEVNGVAALGYRGETEHLAQALGGPLDDVTVEVLNVWIAEGSTWLIELDASLFGDSEDLTRLIGPGYPGGDAEVSIRHRVSDLGTVETPVTPPG